MRYSMTLTFVFLVATVCMVAPAWAGNIVGNPGFETGDFTGWTANPSSSFPWTISTSAPHSGSYKAETGCVGAPCIMADPTASGAWLYQDLTTTPGQTYNLSFWYNSGGGSVTELNVSWGGTSVIDLVDAASGYNQYSVSSLLASSGTTRLEFLGRQDPGFLGLDDVDVESAVPEPATLVLLAGGLLLIGGVRRIRA